MKGVRVGILTISDRSSSGERQDASGPALVQYCTDQGWKIVKQAIIPDELDEIKNSLTLWSDDDSLDLVLTTGGTGFSPRDVTPEATRSVIEKDAPGLSEAMRAANAQKTPFAYLSRAIAGIRKTTLIINLPGSPKGALEGIAALTPILEHGIELLKNTFNSDRHY